MGLDMYLNKSVSRYRKDDGTYSTNMNDCKFDKFGRSNSVEFKTQAAYWRKCNQIHRWFVENVQSGNDDCREYDVEIDQLKSLRELCMSILRAVDGQVVRVPKSKLEEFEKNNGKYGDKLPVFMKIDASNLDGIQGSCYHVLSKKQREVCESKLPTVRGFFFGSTEFDMWYVYEFATTVMMLDELLADYEKEKANGSWVHYTYQASW